MLNVIGMSEKFLFFWGSVSFLMLKMRRGGAFLRQRLTIARLGFNSGCNFQKSPAFHKYRCIYFV